MPDTTKKNLSKARQIPELHVPYQASMFRSALSGRSFNFALVTLRESTMMALMNEMTDKRDWHKEVFDDHFTKEWKKEAMETDNAVTEPMVDWCIEELRYRSKSFEATGIVTVYDADVVKSDLAVPEDLRTALMNAVKPLEDVPAAEKDWNPDFDGEVLDLVNPSLFPLVYGLSRILSHSVTNLDDCINRCGEGITFNISPDMDPSKDKSYSDKFQWLPCDVDISGDVPKITSYINNLHPHRHRGLYSIIENIIECAIPLWNAALTPQRTAGFPRPRISVDRVERPEISLSQKGGLSGIEWNYIRNLLEAVQPEVGLFTPDKLPPHLRQVDQSMKESMDPKSIVDLKRDYADRGLQVIVKLTNIQLTPEKPEYEGDTLHIEGQSNEHICAIAMYCYDDENVTGSFLGFQQMVNPEDANDIYREDEQYHQWLPDIFGCAAAGKAIQDIGDVNAREGRLLAFPNIIRHEIQPFYLVDPTKPGHRKILALFLVDPNIRIISTANTPCQRLDWWCDALEAEEALRRLPFELKDKVYNQVEGFPVSMQMAKELRSELMEERRNYTAEFERSLEAFSIDSLGFLRYL